VQELQHAEAAELRATWPEGGAAMCFVLANFNDLFGSSSGASHTFTPFGS